MNPDRRSNELEPVISCRPDVRERPRSELPLPYPEGLPSMSLLVAAAISFVFLTMAPRLVRASTSGLLH